ncbi:PapG chaperone-binding domain-containing protein [Shewanella frigidimarina]|uniref:PapG chaperone-binding domain-containing protein n=1 Tax=Shewanella frigidimarina TaxID=56812 RepID=UPI003170BF7F
MLKFFIIIIVLLGAAMHQCAMATSTQLIWNSNSTNSGNLNYDGISGGIVRTELKPLDIGRATLKYCNGFAGLVYVRQTMTVMFIPRVLVVNNENIAITPSSTPNTTIGIFDNDYYIIKTTSQVQNVNEQAGCQSLGNGYYFGEKTSRINLKLSIPNSLVVNSYLGKLSLKSSFVEMHASGVANLQKPSDEIISTHSTGIISIPYSLNITGSCSTSTTDIAIDHGSLHPSVANNNEKKVTFTFNCDSGVNATLGLVTNNPSTLTYPGGLGVALGQGWNSLLKLVNPDNNEQGSSFILSSSIAASHTITLSSTLQETALSDTGSLNGSAMLMISFN